MGEGELAINNIDSDIRNKKYKISLKIKGFSLIELMVIVTIISILAAVAIPSYRSYTAKAKVAEAVAVLKSLERTAYSAFEQRGSAPASISFAGGISVTGWADYSTPVVRKLFYAPIGTGMLFCALTKDIGIPDSEGFTVETGAGSTKHTMVCSKVWYDSTAKQNKFACGQLGDARDIPLDYLPGNCQCTNVGAAALSCPAGS